MMTEPIAAPRLAANIPIEEIKAKLSDPVWRLGNLYTIVTDSGQAVPFRPNPEQWQLFRTLHWNNLILKARQLGFTTFAGVLALDQAMFNKNFTALIIAHTKNDVAKIFRNKVLAVYKALPPMVQALRPLASKTKTEMLFENGSSVSVDTGGRGGTLQFLHVSEMGKIARRFPEKATEIVTGAFQAVPNQGGIRIVESTAEGRSGEFYKMVTAALKLQQQGGRLTPLDDRLHFYPWFAKPSYAIDPAGVVIREEARKHSEELFTRLGVQLRPDQLAWYSKKLATLGDNMQREFPGWPEEAFAVALDGLIYGKEMRALRLAGRIGHCPVRPGLAVNTFWDLGVNDRNCIWLHQRVGAMNRFVGFLWDQGQGMRYYWEELEEWRRENGARWGCHYLPHDAEARLQGEEVETRKEILERMGMRNIKIVPRVADLRTGIELTKNVMPECEFDEEATQDGLDCLDNYSREWDDDAGDWARKPRHDVYSNGADAFRQFAQGYRVNDEVLPDLGSVAPTRWGRGGY